jgi:hypothetical protein
MTTYWSCSKIANLIRGKSKPYVLSSSKWNIRCWIAETALDAIQDFIYWPFRRLYDIKYYINNRWVTKTHQLTAKASHLKRGQWVDVDNRFLPCLFDELVDFVEIEKAWLCINCDDEAKKKYSAPWWSHGIFRWRTWRSAEAGIAHLTWESKLIYDNNSGIDPANKLYGKPMEQAKNAIEILSLYNWWKKIYSARLDPMDSTGWTDYCNNKPELLGETAPEDRKRVKKMLAGMRRIDATYEKEDTEMLIRLIKVRNSLWT